MSPFPRRDLVPTARISNAVVLWEDKRPSA